MKNKYFSLVLLVSLGLTGGLLQEPFRRIKGEALENVLRTFYIPSEGLKEWRDFVLNEFIEEIETLKIIGEKESRTGSGEEIRFFFSQKQERFWQNPQALPHIVFLYEGERERIGILSGPIFTADGLGVALLEDLPSEVVGKIKAKSNNFRGPVMKEERAFKIYLPWANDTQAKETWEREIKSRYLLERIFLNPRFYAGNKESDVHRLSLDASIFSLVPGEGRAIYLPDLGLVSREISISSSWLDLFMQEFAHHFYSANPQIFKEIKLAQRIKTLHPRILERLGGLGIYGGATEAVLLNEAYAHLWQVFISSYQAEPLTVDNPEKEKSRDFSYYQRIFPDETDGLRVGDAELFAEIGFLPDEARPIRFNSQLKEDSMVLSKEYFLWVKERF